MNNSKKTSIAHFRLLSTHFPARLRAASSSLGGWLLHARSFEMPITVRSQFTGLGMRIAHEPMCVCRCVHSGSG